jgi:hypothetical protein
MTEKNQEKMTRMFIWGRNIIVSAMLVALLWLVVDIRDTIKYVQPRVDNEQDKRLRILEESCLQFQDYRYESFAMNNEILHLIEGNTKRIDILERRYRYE